jgi:hypothetical protein
MNTFIDYPLSKKDFEYLASKHGNHCVSIYLPLHKTGKEQNEHLAQANLKYCIKEVQKKLMEYQLSKNESGKYLKPIKQLIDTIELWRKPSDGLAIFMDTKGLVFYNLPIVFETQTYVADHFYLKPLLPLYTDDDRYHVLLLSMDHVKLYEASKYMFNDIFVEDFTPDKLEKAVGHDFKPKMLQFRSGQAPYGAGSFHGHGEGKDDSKKEIVAYFNAINNGIKRAIADQKTPLLLACVDKLYPIYKKVNSYPNLFDKNMSGNPELMNKDELHKESWKLIQPYFEKNKKEKLKQFTELYNTPKTTYEVSDTISAAVNGKIDTLFIQENTDLFGTYDKENRRLTIDKEKKTDNASLVNLSALQTFRQGGKVYLIKEDEMPIKGEPLNALLRY